jgi:predicted nucleic acid-binding protein
LAGSYGIDTSVLVRLVTGEPPSDFTQCVERLNALKAAGSEVLASNQVIGEAYITVQHHYDLTEPEARAALLDVFRRGLVSPLNGPSIVEILQASDSPGLFDRLIADGYSREGLDVLTLDQRMSTLTNVYRL